MYNPQQKTFFSLFSVVNNPKLQGYYAIKYPSGKIEPVHGNIRQVEKSILNLSTQELQKELNTLLSQYSLSDNNKEQKEIQIYSLIKLIATK